MSSTTDTGRVFLTVDEALAILPEGAKVHTFRNPVGVLLGADWSRKDVVKAIRKAFKLELAGSVATSMNHGLVVWEKRDKPALYVETRKEQAS